MNSFALGWAAAACTGLAVFAYLWVFVSAYLAPRPASTESLLERQRVARLRQKEPFYRWFEPLIVEWQVFFGSDSSASNQALQQALDAKPDGLPWKAREFRAFQLVFAIMAASVFGLLAGLFAGVLAALLFAGVIGALMYTMTIQTQLDRLKSQRKEFVRRLPFAVDLLALIMEAGGTFNEALRTLVREESDHPVGSEFATVLHEMEIESQRQALQNLRSRLPGDEDVSEFVFAVIKGEELGTPMARILRNQADQMRLKRSQRAEKASADAGVALSGPGFLIMLACMAIIIGPFLMQFLDSVANNGGLFG